LGIAAELMMAWRGYLAIESTPPRRVKAAVRTCCHCTRKRMADVPRFGRLEIDVDARWCVSTESCAH
jgi:hypothetical protein